MVWVCENNNQSKYTKVFTTSKFRFAGAGLLLNWGMSRCGGSCLLYFRPFLSNKVRRFIALIKKYMKVYSSPNFSGYGFLFFFHPIEEEKYNF